MQKTEPANIVAIIIATGLILTVMLVLFAITWIGIAERTSRIEQKVNQCQP